MEEHVRYPFSNNRVFIKTMQNNQELCRKLVERILGFKIDKVLSVTVEDTMASINNKMPKLDLVLKTPDKIIDVEMQCCDVPALGRRMRYLKLLLQYVKTNVPDRRDKLTMEIAEAVERAHQDEILFEGFMDAESDMRVRERYWRAEGEAKEQSREQALIAAMKFQELGDAEILEFLTDPDRKSVYERFGIE